MGPFRISDSGVPVPNPSTWATDYAMVFVDNPRGTGFSFTDPGTLCTTWQCYGADFDSWLRQFVGAFSLGNTPVLITGESYGGSLWGGALAASRLALTPPLRSLAGHYVPASAYTVHVNNQAGVLPHVNLRGIAVGNGFVAPAEMSSGYADAIFNAGLIDDREYLVAQSYVANISAALAEEDYLRAYLVWDAFLNGDSTPGGSWFDNVTGGVNYYNVASELPASFSNFVPYVSSPSVRAAIHVGNQPFADGNIAVELALKRDVMYTQVPRLEALLTAGYDVLIYNGALDIICGAPLTERYVPNLAWPGAARFRAAPKVVWHDPTAAGVVSGYVRRADNLVQAVVRGGGHMLPYDAPTRALDLITRFIEGRAYD